MCLFDWEPERGTRGAKRRASRVETKYELGVLRVNLTDEKSLERFFRQSFQNYTFVSNDLCFRIFHRNMTKNKKTSYIFIYDFDKCLQDKSRRQRMQIPGLLKVEKRN